MEDKKLINDLESRLETLDFKYQGDIRINIENNFVILTGTVFSPSERLLAEQTVAECNDTMPITNKLAIVPTGAPVDKTLAGEVRDALEKNTEITTENLIISVNDCCITLEGQVSSRELKDEIRLTAESVEHAARIELIKNKLTISAY